MFRSLCLYLRHGRDGDVETLKDASPLSRVVAFYRLRKIAKTALRVAQTRVNCNGGRRSMGVSRTGVPTDAQLPET